MSQLMANKSKWRQNKKAPYPSGTRIRSKALTDRFGSHSVSKYRTKLNKQRSM